LGLPRSNDADVTAIYEKAIPKQPWKLLAAKAMRMDQ